jgi:hypothetical protein
MRKAFSEPVARGIDSESVLFEMGACSANPLTKTVTFPGGSK